MHSVKCPKCGKWIKMIGVYVAIYLPDDEVIAKVFSVEAFADDVDRDTSITERVVAWCSRNGYCYDDCGWGYEVNEEKSKR